MLSNLSVLYLTCTITLNPSRQESLIRSDKQAACPTLICIVKPLTCITDKVNHCSFTQSENIALRSHNNRVMLAYKSAYKLHTIRRILSCDKQFAHNAAA